MDEFDKFFAEEAASLENPVQPDEVISIPRIRSASGLWQYIRTLQSTDAKLLPALSANNVTARAQLGALNQLIKKHGMDAVFPVAVYYANNLRSIREALKLTNPPSAQQLVALFPRITLMLENIGTSDSPESGVDGDFSDW